MSANSFSGVAAEFPHDNPELFAGPGWLAVEPCAPPRAVGPTSSTTLHYPQAVPATASALAPDVPRATGDSGASTQKREAATAVTVEDPRRDLPEMAHRTDLDRFVSSVVELVRGRDGEPAALELERFLKGGAFSIERLPEQAREALVAQRFADQAGGDLNARTRQTRDAWRSVLKGDGVGLTDWCESTLDEWAAGLAGACLGVDPSTSGSLRRQLRAQGVLAFGMLATDPSAA